MSQVDFDDSNEESSEDNDINEKNDENSDSLSDLKVAWHEGKAMRDAERINCNIQTKLESISNKETTLWRKLLKMGSDGPQYYRNIISEWKENGNASLHAVEVIELIDDIDDITESDLLPSPKKVKKAFAHIQFAELFSSLAAEIRDNMLRSKAIRLLYEGLGNLPVSIKIEEALYRQYRFDVDSYIECILQISTCTGNDIILLK